MAGFAKNGVELPAGGMDLEATLFCGQSFSWHTLQGGECQRSLPGITFAGVAGVRAVSAAQAGDTLLLWRPDGAALTEADIAFWRDYFALDEDYAGMQADFAKDPALAGCVACAPGVRVLRQPFFDTLLAFIISQNNHIPRITGIVQRLREGFGPVLPGGEHGFPTPQALAALAPEDLAPIRAGFRAKYLIDAGRKVAGGEVDEAALRTAPTGEARQMLMRINGVGPKVADCVLLYSLARREVAPMDVWMKRAMAARFPQGMPKCAEGREGIAQQYIFHWARHNL